jgi:hypothetical protein
MPDLTASETVDRRIATSKPGTKIYNAAVADRIVQVNLNVDETAQKRIETAGRQIAEIF